MAASQTRTLTVSGVARTYQLYVPDDAEPGAALAVVFHSEGGSGTGMESVTGMNAQADDWGFAVAYPESNPATPGTWTTGKGGTDVAFVQAIIAALVADGTCGGPIYLAGYSKGGSMVNACASLPNVQGSAIVANDDNASTWLLSAKPKAPCPVVIVHGIDDPASPFNPGTNHTGGQVEGARQTALNWVGFNGLNAAASVVTQLTGFSTEEWSDAGGNVLVAFLYGNWGHTWPGGGQPVNDGKLGACPAVPVISEELVNRLP